MAKHKIHHFKGFSIVDGDIRIHVKMDRFSKQFNDAQYELDGMIMTSMLPYMPHNTGSFVDITRARSASLQGTGEVVAAAPPMGRYLYMGKVMVDRKTGKGPMNIPGVGLRFHEGAKLIATDRPLTYSNPKAVPFWFDKAKEVDGQKWIKRVKEIAGGG